MRRNPNKTVQVNLRIKESFRRVLEDRAKRHQVSLNQELKALIEESLNREARQSLEAANTERFDAMTLRMTEHEKSLTALKQEVRDLSERETKSPPREEEDRQ
jgi:hypothetical protein